jgi:hypothetical protein
MMEPGIVKTSKIGLTFVLLILGIFLISSLVQYTTTGTNFFETLSFVFREKCSASLSLSTAGCNYKAHFLVSNCLDKTYTISRNSCSGETKCYGIINYDSFQASCAWSDSPGVNKYVLCIDDKEKDSASLICWIT